MAVDRSSLMRLVPRRLISGSALIVIPSAVGTILTLLAIPLLTRSYSVEAMGINASILAMSLVLSIVLALGLPQTVPSAPSAPMAVVVVEVMFGVALVLAAAFAGGMELLASCFSATTLGIASEHSWWIATLAVALTVNEFMMYLAVREKRYFVIGLSQLVLQVLRAGIQLGAAAMGAGWEGLVLGEVLSRLGAGLTVLVGTWSILSPAVRSGRLSELRQARKELGFGPRTILPTTFLDMGVSQIPLLGTAALYGATAAGYFSLMTKVIEGPTGLAVRHIANVFHGELAETVRTGGSGVRTMVRNSFLLVLLGAAIPVIAAAIYGPTLFALVFGEPWRGAGEGFAIFAVPCLLIAATSAPTRVLVVTRQVWRKIYVFAVFAAGYILALGCAALLSQSHQVAWIGLSVASTVGYLLYFSAAMRAAASAERQ
jgi:O-antigen/teichoic acid export membrane protein